MARVSCRAKASCLGADDGVTRGYRALLEDVVVVLFVSWLQVKIFVRVDSAAATLCAVLPIGGVVVELRCARS